MAQLVVRNIDEDLVRELKIRAARNGQSAEEEHRQILCHALRPKRERPSIKKFLSAMPDGGEDADFVRSDDPGRPVDL